MAYGRYTNDAAGCCDGRGRTMLADGDADDDAPLVFCGSSRLLSFFLLFVLVSELSFLCDFFFSLVLFATFDGIFVFERISFRRLSRPWFGYATPFSRELVSSVPMKGITGTLLVITFTIRENIRSGRVVSVNSIWM